MKRLKSFFIVALAILAAFVQPAPVADAASASLSIVPKKTYNIEAGKSVKDTMIIRNIDSTDTLDLDLRVVEFTFNDDTGTPKLMLDENAPPTTWSLKSYMTIPKHVTIKPNSSKTIDLNISIPAGHGAGSYYSAVVYSSTAPGGGNVGLSASGVTLVFVTIPGLVDENLKLEKFGVYDVADKLYRFYSVDEPKHMAFTVKNDGNVTEAPIGSITLKHMFGKEYTITDVNPNKSLALIGQARTFTSCIKQKVEDVEFSGTTSQAKVCEPAGLWPGIYTAKVNLFYGQNGNQTQEVNDSAVFVYMPWWAVAVLLAILGVIAYFVYRIVNRFRERSSGTHFRKSRRK